MKHRVDLENELIYLGLLDKAREIYAELGDQAVLSYIKSSHRLLSKVYHPDLNPNQKERAKDIQQRLNRVSRIIGQMNDADLIDVIKNGAKDKAESKYKVLVVEDEAALRELYQNVLVMEGYDVRVAPEGESGYREYVRFEPDLVLTDVVMPKVGGLELVQKIRETNYFVKIIYMSGFFGIEGIRKELDADIRQFGYPTLVKPFKISAMLEVVNDYLKGTDKDRFQRGV